MSDRPASVSDSADEEPPRAEEVVDDEDLTLPGSLESLEGPGADPSPEDPSDESPGGASPKR